MVTGIILFMNLAWFQDGTQIFNWDLREYGSDKLLTVLIDQYTTKKPFNYDGEFNPIPLPNVSNISQHVY